MSDSVGSRISANRRRAVNLFRGVSPSQAAETWRCGNDACRVWVQPSKAAGPGRCHSCDHPREAKG